MAKSRKQELQAQIKKLNRELGAIESAESEADNQQYIGRFFKVRNNYSCPEKPSDYWWVYMTVVSAEAYTLKCFEFQTDSRGCIDIRPTDIHSTLSRCYVEIKKSEFARAWRELLSRVESMPLAWQV
jgi:hypothetical protein